MNTMNKRPLALRKVFPCFWGTAETLCDTTGVALSPIERVSNKHTQDLVEAHLGEHVFQTERDQGRALTLEQALALVVHMTADQFAPNVVLVPKGESLLIVNDSSVEHVLQNGAWDANGSAHPQGEPGAPTLRGVSITNDSKTVGPFPTAGVYHIYCTVHPGMNLTIVVQ